ncbi:sentrin-specific protease 2-like [Labeo rohita]|uniref:sentrin-specific protease 2-like n=1 Tax=Labeo rohita TaxID=84645 RepID=UPI0021E209CB|nr:sentrin-specific protease 2-like [Labeo rohita]
MCLLQDIWAGKIGGKLCSKVGPYKLFTWDLERLKPGEKLESEVINAYLTCLVRNFSGRAFVLDSFQATNIWKRKANSMKRVNPKTYDVLVGSVNENDHWTLLMIYPKERRILYLNSFGESRAKLLHSKKVVSDFMASRVTPTAEWQCQALPHSIQKDGTSCGVFVCKFAEAVLNGGSLEFQCTDADIAVMRQNIGLCLLQQTDDLSDLCLSCGDKYPQTQDNTDSWIECESCYGWYHWKCVNQPNVEVVFICHGCRGP